MSCKHCGFIDCPGCNLERFDEKYGYLYKGIGMEKIVDSKDQYSVNEKIILKKINEIIVWIKDHEEDHIFRRQLEERLGTLESAMLDEMKEGSGK